MVELSPENNRLKELNEAFPKIAPHVSTLRYLLTPRYLFTIFLLIIPYYNSFGETITCFGAPITHTVTCYQVRSGSVLAIGNNLTTVFRL